MPATDNVLFLGTGIRSRDVAVVLDVRAQSDSAGLHDVSGHSHSLFPPNGEVELRGVLAYPVSLGDWAAFRVVTEGPPRRSRFRATECRKLFPFEDLSHLSTEATRRLLVETGRPVDTAGDKMVRIRDDEMVQVRMAKSEDGPWRVVPSAQMSRLAVWKFEESRRLSVPCGSGSFVFIDPREGLQQIGQVDWSSDADFVRRVIKSFASDDRHQVAAALREYAEDLEPRSLDPALAQDILRSRSLASLLESEQDVLMEYFSALQSDPAVKRLVDAQILELAEQTVASQRTIITEKLTSELQDQIAGRRTELEAELKRSIDELDKAMTLDLERRLLELERQKGDAIESSIGKRRGELETLVSGLEARKADCESRIELLEARERELASALDVLSGNETAMVEKLDRLTRLGSSLENARNVIRVAVPPPVELQSPVGTIALEDIPAWINECPLLTDKGKLELRRFITLLVAGEVPMLHGVESDDFVEVAQAVISGGESMRLEADPTIIAFEDLWVRAGTSVSTSLREAATKASGDQPRTVLGVISRADRSGARFWYPALAERVRRGRLPRRLPICVTLEDIDSEEAKQLLVEGVALHIDGVIAPGAAVVVPAAIRGTAVREFNLPGLELNLESAMPKLATFGVAIRVVAAERAARIWLAAEKFMTPAEAEALLRESVGQRTSTTPPAMDTSGPNLKVLSH
jgi:hypothetical protein